MALVSSGGAPTITRRVVGVGAVIYGLPGVVSDGAWWTGAIARGWLFALVALGVVLLTVDLWWPLVVHRSASPRVRLVDELQRLNLRGSTVVRKRARKYARRDPKWAARMKAKSDDWQLEPPPDAAFHHRTLGKAMGEVRVPLGDLLFEVQALGVDVTEAIAQNNAWDDWRALRDAIGTVCARLDEGAA